MTLKICRDNLLLIVFFLFVTTYAEARNEYLQNQHPCERGSFEPYAEINQRDYKSGISNEYQDQRLGFRFRMPLGVFVVMSILLNKKRKIK